MEPGDATSPGVSMAAPGPIQQLGRDRDLWRRGPGRSWERGPPASSLPGLCPGLNSVPEPKERPGRYRDGVKVGECLNMDSW